jgi:glutaredoxin
MTLFTKPNCDKCSYVKSKFDMDALGVRIEDLNEENADALAHLAWHELVEVAEKELPILVLDDSTHITGAIKIKSYLTKVANV